MLSNSEPTATIAVANLQASRKFYEEKIGLTPRGNPGRNKLAYRCGDGSLSVYKSRFAGSNKATAATWVLGDELGDTVRTLAGKGVVFGHYDLPDAVRSGDIHVFGSHRVAWFKDPDGNIHAFING